MQNTLSQAAILPKISSSIVVNNCTIKMVTTTYKEQTIYSDIIRPSRKVHPI